MQNKVGNVTGNSTELFYLIGDKKAISHERLCIKAINQR